jgi:TonB family protein
LEKGHSLVSRALSTLTPIENITFSFPCQEDPAKMTPCALGRHCSNCDKTVIDFRKRDLADLTKFLERDGSVCGLFSKSQVQTAPVKSPFRRILASAFIAVGLGAFNREAAAQTTGCDSVSHNHAMDEGKDAFLGTVIETLPVYKNGGQEGMFEFIRQNLRYPSDSAEGRVRVEFMVDSTGKPIDIKITQSLSEPADREVIRVVELMEFEPAMQGAEKIAFRFAIPINFIRTTRKNKNR